MTLREAARIARLKWWHIIVLLPLIPLLLPLLFLFIYGIFVVESLQRLDEALDNLQR